MAMPHEKRTALLFWAAVILLGAAIVLSIESDSHWPERDALAWYADVSHMYPIFGAPGLDIDAFDETVRMLEATTHDVAKAVADSDEQLLVAESLHPIRFLSSLSELEQKRRAFIAAPSKATVRAYNADVQRTITAFRRDLDTLRTAVETTPATDGGQTYHFLNGYATKTTFLAGLDTLAHSIDNVEARFRNRLACLAGVRDVCEHPSRKQTPTASADAHRLPDANRQYYDVFISYNDRVRNDAGLYHLADAPIVELASSRCFPDAPIFYALWEKNAAKKLGLLNNIYFYDLNRDDLGPYLTSLAQTGIRGIFQHATNIYLCPAVANDTARALAMRDVQSVLRKTPLFFDTLYQELAEREASIVATGVLAENALAAYVSDIEALAAGGELDDRLGSTSDRMARDVVAMMHSRNGALDAMLAMVVDSNAFFAAVNKTSPSTSIPSQQLLIARSYPELMFLTYDRNTFDRPVSFVRHDTPDWNSFGLITYDEIRRRYETTDELVRDMAHSVKMQAALLSDRDYNPASASADE